jgi:hypothetical protein
MTIGDASSSGLDRRILSLWTFEKLAALGLNLDRSAFHEQPSELASEAALNARRNHMSNLFVLIALISRMNAGQLSLPMLLDPQARRAISRS